MKAKILEPIITPDLQYIQQVPFLPSTFCIVCEIDAEGNEKPDTDFQTSLREWDRVYSQQPIFKLKKK